METPCLIRPATALRMDISQRGAVIAEFPAVKEADVEVRSFEFGHLVIRLDSRDVEKYNPDR